jgi:hypothetical protein
MAQVSWRADEDLVERVRRAAARAGRSMNDYITVVLSVATDPAFSGSEASAVRERLALAGLLDETSAVPAHRPAERAVAEAGQRAASGTALAELIASGR